VWHFKNGALVSSSRGFDGAVNLARYEVEEQPTALVPSANAIPTASARERSVVVACTRLARGSPASCSRPRRGRDDMALAPEQRACQLGRGPLGQRFDGVVSLSGNTS
jgi:hypothetical protein